MSILLLLLQAAATGPSFDCGRARTDIERTICASSELAALDREEARLYRIVLAGPPPQRRDAVERQRQFLKDRDDCRESAAPLDECLRDTYLWDIGELRRVFGLLGDEAGLSSGPVRYRCDGGYPDIFVTRFRTTPEQAQATVVTLNEGQPLLADASHEGRLIGRYATHYVLERDGSQLRSGARICSPYR